MPITRLENPRIYRQIADQLKRLIENNEFPPGSRLPSERDLAQQLQVSRASVREALIALEVIGLVDVKVGNGVIVRSQTPLAPSQEPVMAQAGRNQWAEIDDELNIELDFNAELPPFSLLQTRLLIEPETAALAARHATDEELAGIRAAYEQNCRDNRAGSATHPGDRLFHIRIARPAATRPMRSLSATCSATVTVACFACCSATIRRTTCRTVPSWNTGRSWRRSKRATCAAPARR